MSLDLDSLDALLAKATPGVSAGPVTMFADLAIAAKGARRTVAPVLRVEDAELFVALRNAAPALVAELRAAREKIATLDTALRDLVDGVTMTYGDYTIARLRASSLMTNARLALAATVRP